jgi:hypothetical protein
MIRVSSIQQCTVDSQVQAEQCMRAAERQRGIEQRASDEARCAEERRTTVGAGTVPLDFAELRAKGGSRFDIADDGGEDFIERAAVELQKLIEGETIRIADRTGFALTHGIIPFSRKEAPLEGDLLAGVGCGLIGRFVGRSVVLGSIGVAVEAADDVRADIPGGDRLVERLFGSAAFRFDLIGLAAEGALDLNESAFLQGGGVLPELAGADYRVPLCAGLAFAGLFALPAFRGGDAEKSEIGVVGLLDLRVAAQIANEFYRVFLHKSCVSFCPCRAPKTRGRPLPRQAKEFFGGSGPVIFPALKNDGRETETRRASKCVHATRTLGAQSARARGILAEAVRHGREGTHARKTKENEGALGFRMLEIAGSRQLQFTPFESREMGWMK